MSKNPVDQEPTLSFSEAFEAENRAPNPALDVEPTLAQAAVNSFKLALYSKGHQMGWLGQNSGEWAILVADEKQALILEYYPYNGVTYYRKKGTGRYMSVSDQAYIGFYAWLGATGFTMKGEHLVSDYKGQQLSFYSIENAYLYAWDKYTVLEVKVVDQ
jgi:hypothetical protein